MFLRSTSFICSVIFRRVVSTWDTMTAVWRYSLLGAFQASQPRGLGSWLTFSVSGPLLKCGLLLLLWLSSPSLSTVINIFINLLWAGASLALRKFHSVTKKTCYIFPWNCSPKCPEMVWLPTWDWKMNPLRMAGLGSDWLLPSRGGTEWVLLFLGGSTWCPRKGYRIRFSKGYFKSTIGPQNGGGWF